MNRDLNQWAAQILSRGAWASEDLDEYARLTPIDQRRLEQALIDGGTADSSLIDAGRRAVAEKIAAGISRREWADGRVRRRDAARRARYENAVAKLRLRGSRTDDAAVGDRLKISPRTIRQWRKDGSIS